ncbi:MAG: alkaline phosphatase family protein [Candidatus Velthaea sp.]
MRIWTSRPALAAALGFMLAAAVMGAPARLASQPAAAHNVILFVPDGLRASIVDAQKAPEMAAVRARGVNFTNPHSVFPTFTTPNAAAMSTGHFPGDTGDFSNTIYAGYKVRAAKLSMTPFIENDAILGDIDEHFGGNFLDEETVLAAARAAGYGTAAIGKLGPAAIFDVTERTGNGTIVIDDSSGSDGGLPVDPQILAQIKALTGAQKTPGRGANGSAGDAATPGTTVANVVQQSYFAEVAAKVVLPALKAKNKPFVMVFWSRDPDGTQHNQGDSLGQLTPGINGPTSFAAIKNADDDLRALRDAVRALGLEATTDVIVSADHGFSTISKQSATSPAAQAYTYPGVPATSLPPGFLALDLGKALGFPVSDPDADDAVVHPDLEHRYPSRGNGLLGFDSSKPDIAVAANGGSDLVYLPQTNSKELAPKVVAALLAQDYVSGLFVDDRLGSIPGTLPLSAINLLGSALTPVPAIVVNFRSGNTGCAVPTNCTVEIADTNLQQGQGMHGSFSRADTANFMAAIGPDFKAGFADPAPVSNADVGMTLASILKLSIPAKGRLIGRVMSEAIAGGGNARATRDEMRSAPGDGGLVTILKYQQVGATRYFDAAGFAGRTVGLYRRARRLRPARSCFSRS